MADSTIDDFANRVERSLGKFAENTKYGVRKIRRTAEAASRSEKSGRTISEIFKFCQQELEKGVDDALKELDRAKNVTAIDHVELRHVTGRLLHELVLSIKKNTKHDELRTLDPAPKIDAYLAKLDDELAFRLRQYDVGLHNLEGPGGPVLMSNNINIEKMSGGALQQGTTRSTQVSVGKIDVGSVFGALTVLENAVEAAGLPEHEVEDIRADIATIKAQLAKAQPSATIVGEAGKSLRNIAEGIAGGLLTSPLVTAAAGLSKAIGI